METETAPADPLGGAESGKLPGGKLPQPREIRYRPDRTRRSTAEGSLTQDIVLVRSHQLSPTTWPNKQILGRIDKEEEVPEGYRRRDEGWDMAMANETCP